MLPHKRICLMVEEMQRHSPTVDFESRALLIHNLVFLHGIMTASERLMEVAASKAKGWLKDYFLTHLEEERGHAAWMADDLKTAGVDVGLPNIQAMELAGAMYYLIEHVSPVCLLGYMAVLEGFPVKLSTIEGLEALHGKQLLHCLRYHAENDPEHRKELFHAIDRANDPLIEQAARYTQQKMDQFGATLC